MLACHYLQALQEEMKSGSYISGGPVNYGGSSKVKVDQKAIEEVQYCIIIHTL